MDYVPSLFASDASLAKGALTKRAVTPSLTMDFVRCFDTLESLMVRNSFPLVIVKPKASLLRYSDFVEICGGVGAVSSAAQELGLVVAPPLDLSASKHYNLCDLRLFEWVIYMIVENRFKSFLVEPPCTTFSPAAFPALRSYREPYGFDRLHPRVLHGNCLAFRCLVLMRVGGRHGRPCGLEQPRRSKMAWLREWLRFPAFRRSCHSCL